MKAEIRDLVTDHSQIFSRGILGFTDFTEDERAKWAPVPQRLWPRIGFAEVVAVLALVAAIVAWLH